MKIRQRSCVGSTNAKKMDLRLFLFPTLVSPVNPVDVRPVFRKSRSHAKTLRTKSSQSQQVAPLTVTNDSTGYAVPELTFPVALCLGAYFACAALHPVRFESIDHGDDG